jgi:hypothetical protein
MRINKFMVGLLVLGLAVTTLGLAGFANWHNSLPPVASDSAIGKVVWTVQGFIELTIEDSTFDFGTIAAGVDSVSEDKATSLSVFSNTTWTLSFSVSGEGSDHLGVSLSANEGKGNASVRVGYSLNNLRSMDPGSYTATVTYTVAAK